QYKDIQKSSAKKELELDIGELIKMFPNDITYQNLDTLNEDRDILTPIFNDIILNTFDKEEFSNFYRKSIANSDEPLTILDMLTGNTFKGSSRVGRYGTDTEKINNPQVFKNNINSIVEFLTDIPYEGANGQYNISVKDILEDIKTIQKKLSKKDKKLKGFLKSLYKNLDKYRAPKWNWKLNILEARKADVLQKKKSTREIAKDLIAPIKQIVQQQGILTGKQQTAEKKSFARPKYIFLMGGPASGKGTLASQIEKEYNNVRPFSMGAALRKRAETDRPDIKELLANGKLVDPKLTIEIATDVLTSNQTDTFIFDGFPRQMEQAEMFFKKIKEMGKLDDVIIIDIDVPFEEVLARVTGRRSCPDCNSSYNINNTEYAPLEKNGEYYCTKCYNEEGKYVKVIQRPDDTRESMETRYNIYLENSKKQLIPFYKTEFGLTVNTINNSQEGMAIINSFASDYVNPYSELLKQTEEDIVDMLQNKILTEDEIKALLSQLAVYLKGKIPATIKNKTINFRTAGVREKMGIFDFDTVALIAQARANIIREAAKSSYRLVNGKNLIREKSDIQKKFFIANDSRFLGKWFSIVEERIFTANGIQCYSVDNPLGTLSTPAISYFLKDLNDGNAEKYGLEPGTIITGSDNITASHNPGDFNGLKPNGIDGAMLSKEETEKISAEIKNIQEKLQRG
ncbi:MAG: nucleoside monophosphate kinase, partial [Elusimicrobia bacterium]|nr:nucleoside monophosphate kinase [Elusimicrobiota bacterium]